MAEDEHESQDSRTHIHPRGGHTVRPRTTDDFSAGESSAHNHPTPSTVQTLPLITEELAGRSVYDSDPQPATMSGPGRTLSMPPRDESRYVAQTAVHHDAGAHARYDTDTGVRDDRADTAVRDEADNQVGTSARGGKHDDASDDKDAKSGGISATQLLAGAGAAATSSVIGGQLGVAGTVVGAGVASIVTALAVTLYSRSLDKGKEKIKQVGAKLATADGAKTATGRAVPQSGERQDRKPQGSRPQDRTQQGSRPQDRQQQDDEEPKTWLQKLRRKRVLYPVAIGGATFVIGIGAVVVAESFTDVDISPGTSQISRSVSGGSEDSSDSGDTGGGSGSPAGGTGQQGTDGGQGTSGEGTSADDGSGDGSGSGADSEVPGQGSEQGGSSDSGGADGAGSGSDSQSGTGSQGGSGSQGGAGSEGAGSDG